jgi:hypothetical protein
LGAASMCQFPSVNTGNEALKPWHESLERNDRRENTRLGLTIALPVNQRNSIKLYASTAVSTSAGHRFDMIGIAWQYRWGAGL